MEPHPLPAKTISSRHHLPLILLALAIVTMAVYWQVHGFDFLNYDDGDYVTDNSHIQDGLTRKSIIWAFTTAHAVNWHPMTWMSHMLDYQIFKLWAGGHHLTNLLFHIANSLLLFLVFRKMTGCIWRSAFVAAVFALHPLHVQSVAWVSERKDLLSAFFWMLTLWAYARYAQRPGWAAYIWIIIFFILGLLSKPMVVTLPFVLLLLDYWPLHRFRLGGAEDHRHVPIAGLIQEKIPLFLLSAISAGITFSVQQQGGAVESFDAIPFTERLANAFITYVTYIIKTLFPTKLAAFYPYPESFSGWKVFAAVMMIAVLTGLALWFIHRAPYVTVGWLWFAGTLVPVIGIVQVGFQSMADRYMYLPMIGLTIPVAWGIPEIVSKWRHRQAWLGISAALALAVLAIVSWMQTGHWKNSQTLFEHALEVTSGNYIAHNNLGNVFFRQGRMKAAIDQFRKAILIKSDHAEAHFNLANTLMDTGDTDGAMTHYLYALAARPGYEKACNNLGNLLLKLGRADEAIAYYQRAIAINPGYAQARYNLGIACYQKGDMPGAMESLKAALRLNPGAANVRMALDRAMKKK